MASDLITTSLPVQPEPTPATAVKHPRIWPAVVLVGLYWLCGPILRWLEIPGFVQWLTIMAALGVLTLLFTIWWLTNRRIRGRDRLGVFAVAVGGGVVAALLSPKVGMAWVMMALPWLFTVWAAWLLVAWRMSAGTRRAGLLAALLLTWGTFTLIRFDGLRGSGEAELHWRWTPTAEELYIAERAQERGNPVSLSSSPRSLHADDWPGFRGSSRDGVVHGTKIATDWKANPPKQLWRQRVGPGWSSFAVVGERLFTQEQRGPNEVVVCLEAATGREVWVHEDAARFSDEQAGPGPRATPTWADGRLYTLGATGILNCLDAVTGQRQWSHNIAAEAGVKPPLPIWGFASSPLVWKGLVVVFAGGEGDKGLLAYRADSGELAWTAAAGNHSYSSPQPATLCDEEQILFVGDRGLTAFDPVSGKILWEDAFSTKADMPRSLQPHTVGSSQVLIAAQAEGTMLLDLKRDGDTWTVSRNWTAKSLKPSFNDFVVHGDAIYGFDGNMFACVDARTGERRWKDGRYEHGQVLLLADQSLLVVSAENGQVILLAANPEEHQELGRFRAIEGKTWNHPVIAQGRLFVRNGEQIACYQLEPDVAR
jgi:outer membrane protein assembly factor BamB